MKEPVSVIIRSPAGTWRVNLEGPDGTTSQSVGRSLESRMDHIRKLKTNGGG